MNSSYMEEIKFVKTSKWFVHITPYKLTLFHDLDVVLSGPFVLIRDIERSCLGSICSQSEH
jgi:hypothetical protein